MENNQQSFWQFSDQLRLHTSSFSNLSINDSTWSTSVGTKRPDRERRNFDVRVGGELNSSAGSKQKASDLNGFADDFNDFDFRVGVDLNPSAGPKQKGTDFNGFNDFQNFVVSSTGSKQKGTDFNGLNNDFQNFVVSSAGSKQKGSDLNGLTNDVNGLGKNWKAGLGAIGGYSPSLKNNNFAVNGGFNKGIYSKPGSLNIYNKSFNSKFGKNGKEENEIYGGGKGGGKKNNSSKNNNNSSENGKNGVDKRFKTLPPSEALPRNETIGGYIFVCNNDTMHENLKRQLFGLPPRYRDSVRAITPGLPLFLYNYSTHQLHGIFEAASFGGSNLDQKAWEDKKCPGESRFPAQVRVMTRKVCEPLEEDSFRPILHHYDGPKFRLELNIPEALSLLDIFEENNA